MTLQIVASLTIAIYDHTNFIVQATGQTHVLSILIMLAMVQVSLMLMVRLGTNPVIARFAGLPLDRLVIYLRVKD